MNSCHVGPVFLLRCVSHVILKSISDLIAGSQIAQFRFLPFVDDVVCSEDWIQGVEAAGSFLLGWVGCDRAAVRTCVTEGLTCPSESCLLIPICASPNACASMREVVYLSSGERKMNKVRLLTPRG